MFEPHTPNITFRDVVFGIQWHNCNNYASELNLISTHNCYIASHNYVTTVLFIQLSSKLKTSSYTAHFGESRIEWVWFLGRLALHVPPWQLSGRKFLVNRAAASIALQPFLHFLWCCFARVGNYIPSCPGSCGGGKFSPSQEPGQETSKYTSTRFVGHIALCAYIVCNWTHFQYNPLHKYNWSCPLRLCTLHSHGSCYHRLLHTRQYL